MFNKNNKLKNIQFFMVLRSERIASLIKLTCKGVFFCELCKTTKLTWRAVKQNVSTFSCKIVKFSFILYLECLCFSIQHVSVLIFL